MPKSVTVTVTLSFSCDVPKSWKEDDLQSRVADALLVDVKSNSKKVELGDIDVDDITVEDDED